MARPYVLKGEVADYAEINARVDRVRAAQGPLGQFYGPGLNPVRSPEEYERELQRAAEARAIAGGLPDSPDDPPRAVPAPPARLK